MVDDLWAALALVMVLEGLMPMLVPEQWKATLRQALDLDARTLRIIGAALVVVGLMTLQWVRQPA